MVAERHHEDRLSSHSSSKRCRWTKKMIEVVKRLSQAGREAAFYLAQQSAGGSDLTELVPTDIPYAFIILRVLALVKHQLDKRKAAKAKQLQQCEDRDI